MTVIIYFGGILNRMYFTIPVYLWMVVFAIFLGIAIIVLWYFFFWLKLKPYKGVLACTIFKLGASFVFDDNMLFDFITDRSSKVIFNETFKQAQEAENDNTRAPAATIGKVHTDFIFDPDKWTYPTSYQHKIIEDIAERWNSVYPDDQVRTLVKFSRYMHEGRFDEHFSTELSHLKQQYIVPWARIRMMYKDREESGTFGFVMTLANTIKNIEQQGYNQYALLILGFFGILDLVMVLVWFISRKPPV